MVAKGSEIHRPLMLGGLLVVFVPHARHIPAREPFLASRGKPNHRPALIAHEVFGGDAHGPAIAARLADDLVRGVNVLRSPDARHGFHVFDGLEEFHADGRGAQAQVAVEAVDQVLPVDVGEIGGDDVAHGFAPGEGGGQST